MTKAGTTFRKAIAFVTLLAFVLTSATPGVGQVLPAPGSMVSLSSSFQPAMLQGLKVYADEPFRLDFILDKGDLEKKEEGRRKIEEAGAQRSSIFPLPASLSLEDESQRLIRYFLAALTVPEEDLWVNLSPYEKDRIVPDAFGKTEMGRDLLAQDYLLKQITASVIYPEGETGKKFWKEVYEKAYAKYGTTDIPVDTFNKVWIVPQRAVVYEKADERSQGPGARGQKFSDNRPLTTDHSTAAAYVVESRLKVMLESDYLAKARDERRETRVESSSSLASSLSSTETDNLTKQILREIVIPILEKEVNEGENFAVLRQVYQSLILASWYKKKVKESILLTIYKDKNKVAGLGYENSLELRDESLEQKQNGQPDTTASTSLRSTLYAPSSGDPESIWQLYVEAFKNGAYNYIKEEPDCPPSLEPRAESLEQKQDGQNGTNASTALRSTLSAPCSQMIPRKYFSGGMGFEAVNLDAAMSFTSDPVTLPRHSRGLSVVPVQLKSIGTVRPHLFRTPVNLNELLKNSVLSFRDDVYKKRRIDMQVPKFAINILGRATDLLEEAFWELAGNALKYSENSDDRVVHVRLEQEGPMAVITIQDHGIGIPAQELASFGLVNEQRGETAKLYTDEGLGHGYYHARSVVETYYNGSVKIESAGAGQGTTVTVRIPVVDSAQGEQGVKMVALDGGGVLQVQEGMMWPVARRMVNMVTRGIGDALKDGDKLLEIGTGTGILLIQVLRAVRAQGKLLGPAVATDIDPVAVRVARENFRNNLPEEQRPQVLEGDLFDPLGGELFNTIFWNPPWFDTDVSGAERQRALFDPGHYNLVAFLAQAVRHLNPGGKVYIVLPEPQFEEVRDVVDEFYSAQMIDSYQMGESSAERNIRVGLWELSLLDSAQAPVDKASVSGEEELPLRKEVRVDLDIVQGALDLLVPIEEVIESAFSQADRENIFSDEVVNALWGSLHVTDESGERKSRVALLRNYFSAHKENDFARMLGTTTGHGFLKDAEGISFGNEWDAVARLSGMASVIELYRSGDETVEMARELLEEEAQSFRKIMLFLRSLKARESVEGALLPDRRRYFIVPFVDPAQAEDNAASEEFHALFSDEMLLHNPLIANIFQTQPSAIVKLQQFLKRDHPLKIDAFDEIDRMSPEKVILEIDRVLAMPYSAEKGIFLYVTSLNIYKVFLRVTSGEQDIPQAFVNAYNSATAKDIDRLKAGFGEGVVRPIIRNSYLLLKALWFASKDPSLLLFRDEDLEKNSALLSYYFDPKTVVRFSDDGPVYVDGADRFLSFGALSLSRILPKDGRFPETLEETTAVLRAQHGTSAYQSLQNYLKLLDILSGVNVPSDFKDKKNELAAWAQALNRPSKVNESARESATKTNRLLKEAIAIVEAERGDIDNAQADQGTQADKELFVLDDIISEPLIFFNLTESSESAVADPKLIRLFRLFYDVMRAEIYAAKKDPEQIRRIMRHLSIGIKVNGSIELSFAEYKKFLKGQLDKKTFSDLSVTDQQKAPQLVKFVWRKAAKVLKRMQARQVIAREPQASRFLGFLRGPMVKMTLGLRDQRVSYRDFSYPVIPLKGGDAVQIDAAMLDNSAAARRRIRASSGQTYEDLLRKREGQGLRVLADLRAAEVPARLKDYARTVSELSNRDLGRHLRQFFPGEAQEVIALTPFTQDGKSYPDNVLEDAPELLAQSDDQILTAFLDYFFEKDMLSHYVGLAQKPAFIIRGARSLGWTGFEERLDQWAVVLGEIFRRWSTDAAMTGDQAFSLIKQAVASGNQAGGIAGYQIRVAPNAEQWVKKGRVYLVELLDKHTGASPGDVKFSLTNDPNGVLWVDVWEAYFPGNEGKGLFPAVFQLIVSALGPTKVVVRHMKIQNWATLVVLAHHALQELERVRSSQSLPLAAAYKETVNAAYVRYKNKDFSREAEVPRLTKFLGDYDEQGIGDGRKPLGDFYGLTALGKSVAGAGFKKHAVLVSQDPAIGLHAVNFLSAAAPMDAASVSAPGGIDLRAQQMNVETRGSSGGDLQFDIDPAMLHEFENAPGLVPVIMTIQPLESLPVFLGMREGELVGNSG